MITQSFSSPMLAEGIGAVTSQFKKGGMTKKNKKMKLSKKDIDLIEKYAEGGKFDENKAMVMLDNRTIKHHSNELESALKSTKKVPAWVVAKTHKASGDLSDITHFVENKDKFAKGGNIDEIKVGDYFMNTENGEKFYIDKINKEDKSYPYFVTKSKPTDLGEVISFVEWNRYNKAGLYERVDEKFAKGGKTKTKFSKGDKVFGQFRYEYGEGLRPVSLMDYADRVNGVISNVRKIDNTTMYVIDFENGEQLQYPDFAIDNFISKRSFAKGGSTDPKPSAQDILKRLGYDIPAPSEEEVEEPKIIRGWVDDEPYYFKGGGMSKDNSPKVYIADLTAYNNGQLIGKWFDLTDYSDGAELMADVQEMLDEQTKKDKYGDVHEEWAVHDYENFPSEFYSEYMGEADFDNLINLINEAEDSNLPFDVIAKAMADLGKDEVSEVVEAYFGSVPASMGNEWRDFAYEYVDMVGGISGVSNADYYFDYESFGSDERINMGSEEEEEMGYEDMSDLELGEELVEQVGGIEGLDESTIQMYFDYDKFGRELQYDFTSIRGEDGNYYFFNSNFKKGGKLKSKPQPEDDGEYVLSEEEKQIIRGYVDDEPYYFADGGEITADEKRKSLKGNQKLKF